LFLVAVAVLPFATVRPREFTNWDDVPNIVENGVVRHLTATNVGWMFTHEICANYIPLTWLSHALDWIIWGDSAWGHGLTNALLHAVCCLLLVACLRRGGLVPSVAFTAGLLFAVHPIHAENVAWLSGRKDLVCSVALLACLHAYMGWRQNSLRFGWWWSLIWLVVAGLGKPMAMSAIVPLWFYDAVWIGPADGDGSAGFGSRFALRRATTALLPHAVVCVVIAYVGFLAQHSGTAIASAGDRRWAAIDLVGCNLAFQMLRCWAPFPFSTFLPRSLLEDIPMMLRWLVTVVLVAATIVIAVRASASRLWKGFVWWWFGALGFLVPVSGVIPLGHTSMADRYLYLPSVGPCIFAALALGGLGRNHAVASRVGALAAVLGLGWLTHERAAAWRDSFSLWGAAVAAYPHCELAWHNLSYAYADHGEVEGALQVLGKAMEVIPDDPLLPVEATTRLMNLHRLREAEYMLVEAIRRHPDSAELIVQQGVVMLRLGNPEKARGFFDAAARLRPEWELPILNLGYAFEDEENLPAAIAATERALELAPRSQAAFGRLAALLIKAGRTEDGLATLRRMTAVIPYAKDAWQVQVNVLRRAGRIAEAEQVAREAARYIPFDKSRY
jgi:Flp pilus assembly protein TadD